MLPTNFFCCLLTLLTGNLVTPKTDPGDYVVESNTDLRLEAGEQITLKPGVHIKAGAKFHAKIDPQICTYCSYSGISHHSDGRHLYTTEEYVNGETTGVYSETLLFKLYPNPSSTTATIEIVKEDIHSFAYDIFDISGKLIERGVSEGKIKQLSLPQGMYIVKVKTNELWESKKLVMY